MNNSYRKIIDTLGPNRVINDELLSKYSTFKTGGNADLFFRAKTGDDLVSAISVSLIHKVDFRIIGYGTNILFSDKGYQGLIIRNETDKISLAGMRFSKNEESKKVYLMADTGVGVNRLVRYSLDQGLGGLENFSGQPGSLGGAIYINAHNMAKNDFFGSHVVSVKVINNALEIYDLKNADLKFAYDESIFQNKQLFALSAVIEFFPENKDSLWEKANESLAYRQETQPYGLHTAGCTFRNIKKSDALRIASPGYTLSSGYLIDKCGLKGKRQGRAYFSEKHANFIIAEEDALSSDIYKLIKIAKEKVYEKFGVKLKEEIVLIGDFE